MGKTYAGFPERNEVDLDQILDPLPVGVKGDPDEVPAVLAVRLVEDSHRHLKQMKTFLSTKVFHLLIVSITFRIRPYSIFL